VKVWIGNMKEGTTVEMVAQLLHKYGLPQPERVLEVPEGAAPGMLLEFQTGDAERLRRLLWRIEGLYWNGGHLMVTPMHF
jgi:hypothetical protein